MISYCDNISEKLISIFKYKIGVDIKEYRAKFADDELFGKELKIEARDLVYLFFEIEKEFNITIPQEDIVAKKFNTFNNIIHIIKNQLQEKEKDAI